MDLDLHNIEEVKQIRLLIINYSAKKKKKQLIEFFDELIKIKNTQVNESLNADYELPNDTLYSSDSD